jgi:hypothetical protein
VLHPKKKNIPYSPYGGQCKNRGIVWVKVVKNMLAPKEVLVHYCPLVFVLVDEPSSACFFNQL